ncbi:MAG: phytanoyl-CoA dioxygenase family protein [Candidatus Limnocylindria bacterium]
MAAVEPSELTKIIDDFCADGFLVVRGAVPPDVVRSCVEVVEAELRRRAVDPRDPTTWTAPVRFPSMRDPGDAGWHIDGSYDVDGAWWVNVRSRGRGLLALFLFTDVGEKDAPTELIVGSHLDVPRVLAPFGERGVFFGEVVGQLPGATFERPRMRATGRAGDVFLCHPFLVHRATWPHRGTTPRIVAQPAVAVHEPFVLRASLDVCPVERAILRGLEQ